MKISKIFKKVVIGSSVVELKRTEGGVIHVRGEDSLSMHKALGYIHAHERLLQMLSTRTVAAGELTHYLPDKEHLFALDVLMRKIVNNQDVLEDINNLSDDASLWCLVYCEGVNKYIEKFGLPILGRILKFSTEPWSLKDIFKLIKMQMYLGLGQVQERLEYFILQAIHDGVDVEKLKKLFFPYLEKIDTETIHIIRKLCLQRPYINTPMQLEPAFSNNWAVSGVKSHSGLPLCANDPHLQVDRLPAFWYEVILQKGEDFQMGITIPGFPGLIMGRTKNISASFTYGMLDGVDLFIEEIKDQHYRRQEGWKPLCVRREIIKRKKKGIVELNFFESDAGIIDTKKYTETKLKDGFYISLAWNCAHRGVSPLINAFAKLWDTDTVFAAGKIAREMTLSCNWIFTDIHNNIAYQQSGLVPKREHTTLFPLLAWKKENLWQGFVSTELLSSSYNPTCGFVVSANDDKNQPDKPLSITAPFAPYRYERITHYLSQDTLFSSKDMQNLQCDLYSLQAEKYLAQLQELIPKNTAGDLLRNWDCRYTKKSKGATLFEAFYAALLQEVFGKVFGQRAWQDMLTSKNLLMFTHGNFDRILLSDDENWFGSEGKKKCLTRILEKTCTQFLKVPEWGKKNRFSMRHILFKGRISRILGFDQGLVEIDGGRATVATSFIFRENKFAAAASYRFVTDLSTQEAYTILAGGPSERRFSRFYTIDVDKWLTFKYKKLAIKD